MQLLQRAIDFVELPRRFFHARPRRLDILSGRRTQEALERVFGSRYAGQAHSAFVSALAGRERTMSIVQREVGFFRLAERFASLSRDAKSDAKLKDLLQEICVEMGFAFFALVHHVDFRLAPGGAIVLHNYPADWIEYFTQRNLFAIDPIHRASRTTNLGFTWSKVPRMIKFTAEDAELLRKARVAGIGDGFTVPANVPGEPNGSCSFATTPDRDLCETQFHMAQLIGAFAFEAARRLARARLPSGEARSLTQRQRECLSLVARGKTDWEISRILGVSHETVIQHLKAAKERYGVYKRVPLAVRALYDGSISFAEVLDHNTHF